MTDHRLTNADYDDMAADYAANPVTAGEVLSIDINPAYLRMGRPTKDTPPTGKTPALPVRLPLKIREAMKRRVKAGVISSESELVRLALVEYLERHPELDETA